MSRLKTIGPLSRDFIAKTESANPVSAYKRLARLKKPDPKSRFTLDCQPKKYRQSRLMIGAARSLSKILSLHDLDTYRHQIRTARLAKTLAKMMGLPAAQITRAYVAALVHDIGKLCIPAEILRKPGKLTEPEYSLMKTHSEYGFKIINDIEILRPIAPIVLQHHERLNGSGYPGRLQSERLLTEAKIIGVADVVDAMASSRPYRPALEVEKVIEELQVNRNILYSPDVVDQCIALLRNTMPLAVQEPFFRAGFPTNFRADLNDPVKINPHEELKYIP